jgi:hypothetical protein
VKRRFAVICLGPLAAMSIAVGTADAHSSARGGVSGAASATRQAVAPATKKPTIDIYDNGYAAGSDCGDYSGFDSQDWTAYTESYFADGQYLTNYQLGCVFNTGDTSGSYTSETGCGDGGAPNSTSGGVAQFADGEESLVCGEPDVTASDSSDANSSAYYPYFYGDYCNATVLTGKTGKTDSKVGTDDEVLWYQPYTDYDGTYVNSVTNVCVGVVPETKGISSSVATHKVACSEDDPYTGKTIKGSGVTTTYPDRQFEEVCNIPNAKT